jgi:hypothetical protein
MTGTCRGSGVPSLLRGIAAGRPAGCAAVAALLAALVSACASAPPAPPPEPAPAPPPVAMPAPAPTCPPCEDQSAEIARLQQELARRDAELRDLQAQRRDQARALQETTKQATRAKVKLRRLATQADAASYVAEVEIALEAARAGPGAAARAPLLTLAEQMLASSSASFARGDYGVAMDFAAQAEQLALAGGGLAADGTAARANAEARFDPPVRLRAGIESNLRRGPRARAKTIGVLQEGTPVVARGYRDGWLQVETEDGRSGWMHQSVVATR